MECAYCAAIVFICLNVFIIFVTGRLTLVSKHCIDSICEVALALVAKTMIGATFHPLIAMLLMSGWYLQISSRGFFCGESIIALCEFDKLMVRYGGGFSSRGWLYG